MTHKNENLSVLRPFLAINSGKDDNGISSRN
jgi:hypothetical protein